MAAAGRRYITSADAVWVPLADVYRHLVALGWTLEDAKNQILEALRKDLVQHWVGRTIRWLPHPPGASLQQLQKLPPSEVLIEQATLTAEVLEKSVSGRGSLHVDWLNSRATRRAGTGWDRIEFGGISCSRDDILKLWPVPAQADPAPLERSIADVGPAQPESEQAPEQRGEAAAR